MQIEFVKNHKVAQGDGKGPLYEAGKVYAFDGMVAETYARKYIARGLAKEVTAPPPKGGKGGRGKTQQPDDEFDLIQIRQDMNGEERVLYAVKPWPKRTRLSEDMLTASDTAIAVDGDQVKITVANGFAVYKIGAETGAGARDCEIVDSAFEPAPEASK